MALAALLGTVVGEANAEAWVQYQTAPGYPLVVSSSLVSAKLSLNNIQGDGGSWEGIDDAVTSVAATVYLSSGNDSASITDCLISTTSISGFCDSLSGSTTTAGLHTISVTLNGSSPWKSDSGGTEWPYALLTLDSRMGGSVSLYGVNITGS
ncbi:MAG: hypothetical protein ACRENE_16330 [Polyangiaceae bacterium]